MLQPPSSNALLCVPSVQFLFGPEGRDAGHQEGEIPLSIKQGPVGLYQLLVLITVSFLDFIFSAYLPFPCLCQMTPRAVFFFFP